MFSQAEEREVTQEKWGLMVESGVTRVGLLQLVPAEEGSFLLLAEV